MKGFYLTVGEFNRFIKSSFYRTHYAPPKSEEIEKIVGMNRFQFLQHLEMTFKDRYGISTEKYYEHFPYGKLCIDHIKPLRFAETREEVLDLCHYSNFQLLTTRDNIVKEKDGYDIDIEHEDLESRIEKREKVFHEGELMRKQCEMCGCEIIVNDNRRKYCDRCRETRKHFFDAAAVKKFRDAARDRRKAEMERCKQIEIENEALREEVRLLKARLAVKR